MERRESGRRGYTLIELLIVVAVLGLAGSILVPSLVGQDSMKVQAAVRQIIMDLSFAQSDALAQQELRRVQFFDDGSGYAIVRVTEGNFAEPWDGVTADYLDDPLGNEGSMGRYIVNFVNDSRYEGVSITAATIDGKALGTDDVFLVYDALGGTIMDLGVPGIGGTIEITSGEDVFEVIVSPFTGKLTVNRTGG